jgi:hypothetical protein
MSLQTTDCLYSTIKNTSGGSKRFMFLPPHGKTLAAAGEETFAGDVVSAIRSKRANFVAGKRDVAALEAALQAGDVEIVKTPAPILYDPTRDESRQLKMDAGDLYAADPCWLSTESSSLAVIP